MNDEQTPHEVIVPAGLAQPRGFNHAIATRGGRTVWLAGQTALDAGGTVLAPGDVVAQFEVALGNLLASLSAAGGEPHHLVTLTTYIVNMDDYRAHARDIGGVWKRLVGSYYPAMAGIGVARLWDAEALVEVQGVAVVPD
jgi:enamine deaminase RidA (YjgF/YER057c/UK114 family)